MSSSLYSQTQPASRGSTITRKLASKVLSLIEKYESLSLSGTRSEIPLLQKPTHLAPRSAFHRFGKSILARARLFIENASDQTKSSQKLVGTTPSKRSLGVSSKKRIHCTTENESNVFGHDGTISRNSTIIYTGSSLATSTPPVPRILPSSFFSQLSSSNEQPLVRGRVNSRKWRKRVSPPGSRTRDLRMSVDRKESTFAEIKRKLMSPKVSVRDLVEKAGGACTHEDLGSLRDADKSFRVIPCHQVIPKGRSLSPRDILRCDLKSRDRDRFFGELLEGQSSEKPSTYDDFPYRTPRKSDLKESNATLGTTQMACRDDTNYLNTNFQYMADGSLSNLGYFQLRLESEAETPRPALEVRTPNINTSSTVAAQEPRMIRVYRKTPPPSGFFFNPENKIIRDKTTGAQKRRAFYATKLLRAVDIFSPTPMNAVQAAQLRGMVFRYT